MPKQRSSLIACAFIMSLMALRPDAAAFDHIIGGPGRDGVRKMIPLADGGAALVGWQAQQGLYQQGVGVVLRLDSAGHILWSRALSSTGRNQAAAVAESRDGRLFVSLEEYPQAAEPGQVIVVELSAEGGVQRQIPVGGPGKEVADVIKVLPDGQILLAGEQSPSPAEDMAAWITQLGEDMRPVWAWHLDTHGRDRINALVPLPDGSFIAAGNSTAMFNDTVQERPLFVRLAADGTEVWVRQAIVGRPASIRALAALEDGGALFAGYAKRPDSGEFDGWVGRISAGGDLLWHTPLPHDGPAFFHSLILLEDGNALAAGAIRPTGSSQYEGLATIFSLTGEQAEEVRFTRAGSAQIRSVLQKPDKSIRIGGSLTPAGEKDEQMWITEAFLPKTP